MGGRLPAASTPPLAASQHGTCCYGGGSPSVDAHSVGVLAAGAHICTHVSHWLSLPCMQVRGLSVIVPRRAVRRRNIDHARTDVPALATPRHASRIGRRSREIIVPPISKVGTWWATRPTCWCSWYTLRARLLVFRVGRHHHRG